MRNAIRVAAVGATLAIGAVSLTACSNNSGSTDSSSSGSGSDASETGPITYVQGKDTTGVVTQIAAKWNAANPDEKVTVKFLSDNADQQYQDMTQHFQQKLSDYDVVSADLIWTGSWAAKQYLQPLTGKYAIDGIDDMLPSVTDSGKYVNVQYAAPQTTDSQLLYYRTDLLGDTAVPTDWDSLMAACSIAKKNNIGCYSGQFAKYEGLTVNFNERVTSNGGSIIDSDGKPTVTSSEAKAGLDELVKAFQDGNIPAAAVGYQEEQCVTNFENGKLMFTTNWPYMVSRIAGDAAGKNVQGKYAIAGYPGASTVGGHNNAISMFSKHKLTAKKFLEFIETEEIQKLYVTVSSAAPVRSSLYSDAALVKQFPYLTALKSSLDGAKARPVSPYYQGITAAVQNTIYPALSTAAKGGSVDSDSVLSDLSEAIQSASSGS